MDASFLKKIIFGYFAFALAVVVINVFVLKAIKTDKKTYHKHVALTSQESPSQSKKRKHALVPVDPTKYGMMVVPSVSLPRNQAHADAFTKKIINESGVLKQEKIVSKLKEMNITPEEFKERTQDIDTRITHYEEVKNADPADKESEEKLQQLYLLKSIQNAFVETAIEQNTAPAPASSAPAETAQAPAPAPAGENPSQDQP